MRILMVIDSLIKGGTERRMLELIKELSKASSGHSFYLISLTDRVDYNYVYDLPIKFEVVARSSKKDWSLFGKLSTRISSFKPDVIHSWGSMSSVFLAPIAKLRGIKFVIGFIGRAPAKLTVRDTHYLRGKLTFPLSDAIVSNCKAGLHSYKAPLHKSHCIYNGIDFNRFKNLEVPTDILQKLPKVNGASAFIVGMVAAFEDRKDHVTFVEVAVKFCSSYPGSHFILIGSGKHYDRVKSLVPHDLLNSSIHFLGNRSDVESILQTISVGVLLTNSKVHGEGVANSIVEYMASAKPVIATRGGGTDEIVVDNYNGFLIDYASQHQLYSKLEILRNNPCLAKEFGKAGYSLVKNNFDSSVMANSYLNLYNKLLNKKISVSR